MTKKEVTVETMVTNGYLQYPIQLRGWFKKTEATAEIREGETFWMEGEQYTSLSAMAKKASCKIAGYEVPYTWSGLTFWYVNDKATNTLATIEQVRHRAYLDLQEKVMAGISRPNVLMLRLKYGTITDAELNEFHECLDKLIWRNVWNHYCTVEAKDMNSSIWLRILSKCKTWNESMNLHVTTWIWRVAFSEVGKNRHTEKRRSLIQGRSLDDDTMTEQGTKDVPADEEGTARRHKVMELVESIVSGMDGTDKNLASILMTPALGISGSAMVRMRGNDLCQRLGINSKELAERMCQLRVKLAPAMEIAE